MSERASIAVACIHHNERVSLTEWLTHAGYDPVVVHDLTRLDDDLQTHGVEALISDQAHVPREDDVRSLMRRLGPNRPLVILGDTSRLPHAMRSELSVISRPLDREGLLLTVGLALGECRPSRRFARRFVEPIPGTAQGIAVTVREASAGGVGLDVYGPRQVVLPPFFTLRIPEFGVHVRVKRAWMTAVSPALSRCGGSVEGDLADASRSWSEFAREAPDPVAAVRRHMAIRRAEVRPAQ